MEHLQSEGLRHNQDSSHQVEQIESDIKTLKTKLESSNKDSRQSGNDRIQMCLNLK